MNELVALLIAYSFLIIISIIVYRSVMLLRSLWTFLILICFWVFTYFYYGLLLWINSLLIKHDIYIEMGHVDMDLMLFMGLCYLTVIIFTIIIIVRKGKKTFTKP